MNLKRMVLQCILRNSYQITRTVINSRNQWNPNNKSFFLVTNITEISEDFLISHSCVFLVYICISMF